MPRNYASTMEEIARIEAEQRDIIAKDTPTDADKDSLLKAEGELNMLRRVASELHESEVKALQNEVDGLRAKPATPEDKNTRAQLRDMFRSMKLGDEVDLVTPDIQASLASNTGSGSYLVPQEWHDSVEEYKFQANFLRQDGAMVVRTASTHNVPVLSALASPAITGENAAYTASDPTISQVVLYAYKLTDKVPVSEELLEDAAYPLENVLARAIGLSFGKAEQDYFLTGTGSAQPTGIFNKAADLTTDTQNVMTNDEIIETVYTLAPQYRDGAVWMMDNTMAFDIATKKVDITSSGSQPFAWPTMLDGVNPTLLGYKVRLSAAIADKAAGAKAIAFGNPGEYVIGERGPMKIKRLQLSEYGDTFAFAQRIDGKPLNAAAFVVVALHA